LVVSKWPSCPPSTHPVYDYIASFVHKPSVCFRALIVVVFETVLSLFAYAECTETSALHVGTILQPVIHVCLAGHVY
jgi:hypothetical protein